MTKHDIAEIFGIKVDDQPKELTDDEILMVIRECVKMKNPSNKIPYARFEPCLCGCNRRERWFWESGMKLVCKNCGLSVTGNNEQDAKRRWNEYMKGAKNVV